MFETFGSFRLPGRFYQTLLLTSVNEPLGNIVPWNLPMLPFNLTLLLSTQAKHLGCITPSKYLLL